MIIFASTSSEASTTVESTVVAGEGGDITPFTGDSTSELWALEGREAGRGGGTGGRLETPIFTEGLGTSSLALSDENVLDWDDKLAADASVERGTDEVVVEAVLTLAGGFIVEIPLPEKRLNLDPALLR